MEYNFALAILPIPYSAKIQKLPLKNPQLSFLVCIRDKTLERGKCQGLNSWLCFDRHHPERRCTQELVVELNPCRCQKADTETKAGFWTKCEVQSLSCHKTRHPFSILLRIHCQKCNEYAFPPEDVPWIYFSLARRNFVLLIPSHVVKYV